MTKEFWINLPVKDVTKSRDFFVNIGFKLNPGPGNTEHSACIFIGSKNIVLMLFSEPTFQSFTEHEITDTKKSSEVLFSFDAESRVEVDEMAVRVEKAGGTVFSAPNESQGWLYGFGFADLDGHRWNVLFMDMKKN